MTGISITYYGYNGFIVKADDFKIAVDPGASLYLFRLGPVIPKVEWSDITHIVVTHGDPDHYWHADRVARESGAPIICGSALVQVRDGKTFMVSPRDRKLHYGTEMKRVYPMDPGDAIEVDGVSVEAIPATHGDLEISLLFGVIKKTFTKKPGEHFAVGCTGFVLNVGGVKIANLGDTVLLPEWGRFQPDILMVPIGGNKTKNTMDEKQALEAVEMIQPHVVIPCHYNCGVLFRKKGNPADAEYFQKEVERMGRKCFVMEAGEELRLTPEQLRTPGIH
jgi:L-ascorbate metabolism protein UlaG (beta-lactamase superfamily)